MAKEESKERELTWGDVLLGSLLFPYLLTANYEDAYEKRMEDVKKEEELKKEKAAEDKVEKSFGDVEQKDCEKKPSDKEFSVQKVVEACAQKKEAEAEKHGEKDFEEGDSAKPTDEFLAVFKDVNGDDFVDNLVENNKHSEYYELAQFVRDALVDIESGTEELKWEYDPEEVTARLKLNEFTTVDDKTATLFNHEVGYVYVSVKIKKELSKDGTVEYYLVVDL